MKYIKKFNERLLAKRTDFSHHTENIKKQVSDTINSELVEFIHDRKWEDGVGLNLNDEATFINFKGCKFIYRLHEPFNYMSLYDQGNKEMDIDICGEISSNGEIKYTSNIDESDDEDAKDFIVCVKRIQSELGIGFSFSFDNKLGVKTMKIIGEI